MGELRGWVVRRWGDWITTEVSHGSSWDKSSAGVNSSDSR